MDYVLALARMGCPIDTARALNDLWVRLGLETIQIGPYRANLRQPA